MDSKDELEEIKDELLTMNKISNLFDEMDGYEIRRIIEWLQSKYQPPRYSRSTLNSKEISVIRKMREVRMEKGMTQVQLANELKISRSTICRIEKSNYGELKAENYSKIKKWVDENWLKNQI